MSNIITNEWISSIDALQSGKTPLQVLIKDAGMVLDQLKRVETEYLKLMRATAESEEIQANAKINAQIEINKLSNHLSLLEAAIAEVVNKKTEAEPVLAALLSDFEG